MKKTQSKVNPEWKKLGSVADIHFVSAPATRLHVGPAPFPHGAGDTVLQSYSANSERMHTSTEVKVLRRRVRILSEALAAVLEAPGNDAVLTEAKKVLAQ